MVEGPGRYELRKGDELIGVSDFVVKDGVAILPHVEIDPSYEGQGLGSRLVREQLAALKERGLGIDAHCPFVVAYLKRHPDEG
ncbi:N-acetyltransferase [bacterium]|nr:MAG: N-acetyltransferase [bacterium]